MLSNLQNLYLFQSLSVAEINDILTHSSIQTYEPGTIIFYEGDPSSCFSVVIEGQVEIIKSLGSEIGRVINLANPGDYFGEMSIFSAGMSRSASARAAGQTRLLEIPLDTFEWFVQNHTGVAYRLLKEVLQRLLENENTTVQELKEKNRQLTLSLIELKEAQAQIIAKEKMEQELATARSIQESMLPEQVPDLPGWKVQAYWKPARQVSGDFYDFIQLSDGRLAIIIGDVADKGVPAALIMTVTRSTLRAASINVKTPGELLARVNNLLCPEFPSSMFVTCHVSFLNPVSGLLEFASAGHCRPILLHEESTEELSCQGLVLGLFEDIHYQERQIQLQPGDSVLYYSDGLFEAHNQRGEMLGLKKVEQVLSQRPADPVAALMEMMGNFSGPNVDPEDDITLVNLAYLPFP